MLICVGAAIMDMTPDPHPGGCNMNVAVAAARLGAPTAFLGRLSTDHDGEVLMAHMKASSVSMELIQRGPERTARAFVSTPESPEFFFDADGAAHTLLSEWSVDRLGRGPHIVHGGTNVEYFGSTAQALAELVEQVASLGGVVSCDPNIRPALIFDRNEWSYWHGRWAESATIYRCSAEDAKWIWPGQSGKAVAEGLFDKGVRVVIISHGKGGCELHTAGWSVCVPAVEVKVVDTVGAGDALTGSILASLCELGAATADELSRIKEPDWVEILERAVFVAGLTCTRRGADPPWAADLVGMPQRRD
jgi:fructokinase